MKKQDLPTKPCLVCGRPFTWRKKWEKVWEEVKFCSERCRRSKAGALGSVTSRAPQSPHR
ncbi:DUF2256 domain-containing protein [Prosthecobacter sp.]|uniref:DUF2256 domain-containing protein n=1 Tax=Prosthecobacter sp. TaxID=1965333 RepID=UPI003BB1E71D